MPDSKNGDALFEMLARILLRCFVLGYALLLLWVIIYLLAGAQIYRGAKLFGLTSHEVDLVCYCGITFVKTVVLLFFLFPYIAIRWASRKRT
jgi:hypothetical protein